MFKRLALYVALTNNLALGILFFPFIIIGCYEIKKEIEYE
jgi:hypothetical protein